MALYKDLRYENEIDRVKGLQFSILSPEEILARSVCEVTAPELFNGAIPVESGLFDTRMGVIDHGRICRTCEQRNVACPGHFGSITLARPVHYVQFFEIVKKITRCVCFRCSKLLLDIERPEIKAFLAKKPSRQKRWDYMYKLVTAKTLRCGTQTIDGCGAQQPNKITKEGVFKIAMEWTDSKAFDGEDSEQPAESVQRKILLNAEDVLRILRRITDIDADALGFSPKFSRPEWLICTVLPVPPPAVRPSVRNEGGQRCEDDLTHCLLHIVKTNNLIRQKIERAASKESIDFLLIPLQSYVAALVDNSASGALQMTQRTGRPLRALMDRLKGKEGRIRGNLVGKRVDHSARSVITPDPNISIDELGVPLKIAMNLTFPEVVNPLNRHRLKELVENGPKVYPGAKFLRKRSDGRVISLANVPDRPMLELEAGDVVDRHLQNGDYVLFNRQPSLHKMSMMAHRVRVMPYNTFRLNVCVTPTFNADFDGDEMNMHVPQSLQTHEELQQLAAVPKQIITPRESKPIISVVQDITLGVYKITQPHVRITEKAMFNLIAANPRMRIDLRATDLKDKHGNRLWSGRDALSTVIPPTVNMDLKNGLFDNDSVENNRVIVRNGHIVQGICDKSIFQAKTNGLVHSIFNENGSDEARLFFDNTQKIICDWLSQYGFSVGISDLIVDRETLGNVKDVIVKSKAKVYDAIWKVHSGSFENLSTKTNADQFEQVVNRDILNRAVDDVGKVARSGVGRASNRMLDMIQSQAKGNMINFAQMIGCLGQQTVDGKRIQYGFENRTLPHFSKYDDSPDARGFVSNSFISGLTPEEFFFHAMGGREGLIDTAVKSVTGDTAIIVIEDNMPKYVKIGDWIDTHLETAKDQVAHFPEDRNLEMLKVDNVFIPTTDADGNVTWGAMTAVTRHDPGTRLYRVKTLGGREVTVTESKSLLVWDEEHRRFHEKPTPEVKIGDFMPVTANLPAPPTIVNSVDMAKYFPKTEYVHGTDFNKAVVAIDEAMRRPTTAGLSGISDKSREKIPAGWWQRNNGVNFTLPYPKKSLVTRALVRSNTENIHDGCIYPYSASRAAARLPDKFELNHDNGVFIGLYLADGCCHILSGKVSITKEDASVRDFVAKWFDKYAITYQNKAEKRARGVSTSIEGNSTLLAMFLQMFVGHGSRNKHVPDVAFAAPDDFVIGLLSGYFSGDGHIDRGAVLVDSVSARLLEGVSMLCTRMGMFGKISRSQLKTNNLGTEDIAPVHRLSIRSQWATIFTQKIQLIEPRKQKKLIEVNSTEYHPNFPGHHDVVLDAITEITEIGVEENPKMYDVTVPSTLNFNLANGLATRDTSESGYIQRKLVKAMEDLKVCHDYTVRDTNGSIVQFLFGEDGIDPIRRESQPIWYVDKSIDVIQAEYVFQENPKDDLEYFLTPEALKRALDTKAKWVPRVWDQYLDIREDRRFLIEDLFKGKFQNKISYPIAFKRILDNITGAFREYGADVVSDLTPLDIFEAVDELAKELYVCKNNPGNKFLQLLLRCHLAPKPLLMRHRLNKASFQHLLVTIKARFYESLAQPGEMVGVVAAQSIGEPTTQLSSCGLTNILVRKPDGSMFHGHIKDLVDGLLVLHPEKVVVIGNDSVVLNMDSDFQILGVSNDEKTSWRTISQVSRHPANGGMVRVHTKSGKDTCATLSHSFLKRTESSIVPVLGSDLKIGDRVPVAKFIPEIQGALECITICGEEFQLDHDFGWICGAYLADGWVEGHHVCISKMIPEYFERIRVFAAELGVEMKQKFFQTSQGITNKFQHAGLAAFMKEQFGNRSDAKKVAGFVFGSNIKFISGVISGYMDGDGCAHMQQGKQRLTATTVSERLAGDIALLCAFFGIFASITVCTRSDGYQDNHRIEIQAKYCPDFKEHIGFKVHHKAESLDKVVQHATQAVTDGNKEYIDKIPELGHVIARAAAHLKQPLLYRWKNKESIGRRVLIKYIRLFDSMMTVAIAGGGEAFVDGKTYEVPRLSQYHIDALNHELSILRQAAFSDIVWDEIINLEYLDDPAEPVYDFTVPGNDSFMVDTGILVHNTLNSVHYDTELLLLNDNKLERVKIGDYIDAQLDVAAPKDIEQHPNDQVLAWIRGPEVKILSCDENGQVDWQRIEAVTRHPVVNEDGTNTVLKVTTHSGREVIATKGKSFLKRINNKIVPVDGKDLVLGDYLPVSTILPTRAVAPVEFLDLADYLPKEDWLYKSEVDKALELRQRVGGKWWKHQGVDFIVPYNRADSVLAAFIGQPKRPPTNIICRSNCVYPKKTMGDGMVSHIPESIPLDEDFGWLVGAYLSEGCLAIGANKKGAEEKPYAVLISNMSQEFHDRFVKFCDKYDIGYHVDKSMMNMPSGKICPKVTLRMHSLVMGTLFYKMIGHGAAVKRIPPLMLGAPDIFMRSLIDGYYSGDGCVTSGGYIANYSVSRGLLDDLQQVLTRFGIQTRIKQMSEHSHSKTMLRFPTAKRGWTMTMSSSGTSKFKEVFTLCLQRKQDQLDDTHTEREFGMTDYVPNIVTRAWGDITINREEIQRISVCAGAEDKAVFQAIQEENIVYDKIVSIEEISHDRPWMYDFTVANTRTFNLYDGLSLNDSFHLSGYSGASEAVRGVPRLKELLQVSKSIKTPTMKIFIKPDYSQDKNKVQDIKNMLETTYLRDLVTSCSVFYDPNDNALPEDKPFVDLYRAWRSQNEGLCPPPSSSPWVLRLEFDRAKMLDTNTTMLDVERMLMDYDKLSCMFSDDNAHQLVARVRLLEGDDASDDMLMELKALEHSLMETLAVKGVPGILKTAMNKREYSKDPVFDSGNDKFHATHEWVIDTAGTNLREVLASPLIDSRRTISNDIIEIYSVLGVEATRQALYDEIMDVLSDAYVNYCHVALLVDTMTTKGGLSSINRHGINRTDIGPLAKSSFEMTNDVLVKAGVFAEHDRMTGVSANVMLGQIPRYGTGDTEICMDAEALSAAMPLRLPTVEEEHDASEEGDHEPVSSDIFKIDFDLSM